MTEHVAVDEEYLLVEEVADRLGLPLSVLMRRVEAGDIPARRIENENGVHYSLRLSDLGIEGIPSDAGDASPYGPEPAPSGEHEHEMPTVDLTGRRIPGEAGDDREPAQPVPSWLHDDHDDRFTDLRDDIDAAAAEGTSAEIAEPVAVEDAPVFDEDGVDADVDDAPEALRAEIEDELAHASTVTHDPTAFDEAAAAEPPVPAAIIAEQRSPHGDLSSMSLDARELVAGLLDRWERTLEQRIYTEQRQRFQGELTARQNMVKQLQMELHTVRAEHAAAQAEKDRQLAEKERELADRERDLADARRLAEETERLLAPAARRRRWFWQRDD